VIDMLQKLEFLDDITITVDERHDFCGVSRMADGNVAEVKITISVPLLRGLLPPEEIANPDSIPEFPQISRTYLVQFMFAYEIPPEPVTTVGAPASAAKQ
jgi:hypothetical protein